MLAGLFAGGKPPPPQDHLSHSPDHREVGSGFTKGPRRGSLPLAGCLARSWGRVSAGGSGERDKGQSPVPTPTRQPGGACPLPLLGPAGEPRAPWAGRDRPRMSRGTEGVLAAEHSRLPSLRQRRGAGTRGASPAPSRSPADAAHPAAGVGGRALSFPWAR